MTLGRERLRFGPDVPLDARIAAVAEAQHGPIAATQMCACGLGGSGIRRRAQRGKLHRVHRGVYVPGHRTLAPRGRVAAGVLACGPSACASHTTGAWLRELRLGIGSLVHVSVIGVSGRRHGMVIAHSSRRLRSVDVDVVDGIPTTSVARTLLDCAPLLGRRETEKLVIEAELIGAFDLSAVHDLLAHVPGHRGAAILRGAIGDAAGACGRTASDVEDRLLAAFRATPRLPEPECNTSIQLDDGRFVSPDFVWRDVRLIVEADPRGTHDRTVNYRSDRTRDRALDRMGYATMRFNDLELRDPPACAAEVAARHEFRAHTARNS